VFECKNYLKEKLQRGERARGFWVSLEAPTLTEIAVVLGFDWVLIDAEHGHLDFKEIVEHLRVTRGTKTTPLVRIAEIQPGLIKRVLDIGAQGIIVPQVSSAAEVEQAVKFAKYPPWGSRGVGGERATNWNLGMKEYTRTANDQIMVIPLIETVAAADHIDEILAVKGVDALYLGPADFSSSSGFLGEWEGPGVAERLLGVLRKAQTAHVPVGIMASSPEDLGRRVKEGFQMICLGSDAGLLIQAAKNAVASYEAAIKGK
jgi:2-keto-3-deoxy-L-rhamnonate aldolase RhmA